MSRQPSGYDEWAAIIRGIRLRYSHGTSAHLCSRSPTAVSYPVPRDVHALNGSRLPEDPVAAESSPAHRGPLRTIGIYRRRPLPRRPTVRSTETPRHLEDTSGVHYRLDPKVGRPRRRVPGFNETVTAGVELPSCLAVHLALILGQSLVVGLERFGPFESHDSRSSSNSSMSSAAANFPLSMATSACRSNCCQRSVQNQA